MSSRFLGACPMPLVASFDISLLIPQATENSVYILSEFTSATTNVSRGIWHVVYTRTPHAWDGTPHTFGINDLAFEAAVTNGGSIFAGGSYYGAIGTNGGPVYWPCAAVDDSHFTLDGTGKSIGGVAAGGNVYGACATTFDLDMGCANCQALAPIALNVYAATRAAFDNGYSFTVRAQGTRIG